LAECKVYVDHPLNTLPCLERIDIIGVDWLSLKSTNAIHSPQLRSFFSPAQLPTLNYLALDIEYPFNVKKHGPLYDTLLRQLKGMEFLPPRVTLRLSPPLNTPTAASTQLKIEDESKPVWKLSFLRGLWLWHLITSLMRNDEDIYARDHLLRYQPPLNAPAVASQDLQPQKELLSVLYIDTNEALSMFLETLEGSYRLASYAKKTESIYLGGMKEKIEDGNLQRLSELCPNVHHMNLEVLTFDLAGISKLLLISLRHTRIQLTHTTFLACFTKLCCLTLVECKVYIDHPLNTLPYLKRIDLLDVDWLSLKSANAIHSPQLRSFFSPAQLPALNNLALDGEAVEKHGTLYDALLPQLTRLEYSYVTLRSIVPQLRLCTPLKLLMIDCPDFRVEDVSLGFIKSFQRLDIEEFHFFCFEVDDDDHEAWQRAFLAVQKLVKNVATLSSFKKLSLSMSGVSKDSKRAKKWTKIKEDIRKICAKSRITIIGRESKYADDRNERDMLAWMD
jgi:Leucine-rich repeat (LRR) protein